MVDGGLGDQASTDVQLKRFDDRFSDTAIRYDDTASKPKSLTFLHTGENFLDLVSNPFAGGTCDKEALLRPFRCSKTFPNGLPAGIYIAMSDELLLRLSELCLASPVAPTNAPPCGAPRSRARSYLALINYHRHFTIGFSKSSPLKDDPDAKNWMAMVAKYGFARSVMLAKERGGAHSY